MNYYRNIDRTKLQFDFICDSDSTNIPYEEIKSLGGKVIICPPYQKFFKYINELKKIYKEGNYKIVHSHINTLSLFSLYAAKHSNIPIRIAHSHSTTNKRERKRNLIKKILKNFSKVYATDYFCCSITAGKWLFGDKIVNSKRFYLMKNAIDVSKFSYNEITRKNFRKKLNLSDDIFLIGQIGRLVETKNPFFSLELLKKIICSDKNYRLLFVGNGDLLDKLKEKCLELGIEDYVIFQNQVEDIYNYYQALDCLILPSLYEGLGLVLIEAQCSHLNCICSTFVTEEANLNGEVSYLNIEDYDSWTTKILSFDKSNKRYTDKELFMENGYDISTAAINLQERYLKLFNENR